MVPPLEDMVDIHVEESLKSLCTKTAGPGQAEQVLVNVILEVAT